jgi:hypothetical protein
MPPCSHINFGESRTMPAGVSGLRRASAPPLRPRGVRQGRRGAGILGKAVAPTDNARSRGRPWRPPNRSTPSRFGPRRRGYSDGRPAASLQPGHLRSCGNRSKGNLLLPNSHRSRRSRPHRVAESRGAAAWISPVGVRLSRVPRRERDRLVFSPSAKARNTSTTPSSLIPRAPWRPQGRPAAGIQTNRGRSGSDMGSRRHEGTVLQPGRDVAQESRPAGSSSRPGAGLQESPDLMKVVPWRIGSALPAPMHPFGYF